MHVHWSSNLAERVIQEKKEPYIITGGMTTSGPVHFGTLCEMLFPNAIKKALEKKGKNATYYFIADIFDAFDSVPQSMEKYKNELEKHLGKPLCDVPDPTGKSKSFGDHYLDEAKELMVKYEINAEIVRINEYYSQGKFDFYAKFFFEHEEEAKKIIEETSGKTEKREWSPIMPVCQNCGKIATTRVISHDNEKYSYACDKDVKYVKGCGFLGENKISDHRYKIVWRLHWPSWKQIFNTSIEGAGMDHHTKGGSVDTSREITTKLFKKDFPIAYKYGFILFQGKKYSKSKGTGMGITEISRLLMPEVVKYMLLKPDLEENVDIDPSSEKILRKIEEFENASEIDSTDENRSDRKAAVAFSLSTDKLKWKSFLDTLLFYQIYRNWDKVVEMTKDPKGVEYLKPYIEEWVIRDFMPDDYRFKYEPKKAEGNVRKFIETLNENMDALQIHNAVFEFAKNNNIVPKDFFAQIYQSIIGKNKGPRLGKLISAIGVQKIKQDMI